MQECTMPAEALKIFMDERPNVIHHQHLRDGNVRVKQLYTGQRDADIHAAMDADRAAAERLGGGQFYRTRVGRNSSCPCGSGVKFKKCCIDKAAHV